MSATAVAAPTLEDVAVAAGVHPATVSRALRGVSGKVSADKRAEIQRIARELGYQPNLVAASFRTKRTDLAAIVVPDLGNPLFGPIVQGVERALRRQHMMSLVVQTPSAPAERRELVDALAGRQVSGLIVLAAEVDDPMLKAAKERRLPTILVNRGSGDRNFASVVSDDREAVRLVLEHLTGLGHRAIAHIAGPSVSSTGRARREAFEEQTRALGLRTASPVIEATGFTRAAGQVATRQLLRGRKPVTALFAANDLLALGALDVLREHALHVPRDLSLVGHNDMPLVDLIDPPLTTVRVPVEQMSEQAAALFLEQLGEAGPTATTRVLMPTLVVRGSTAPPAAG